MSAAIVFTELPLYNVYTTAYPRSVVTSRTASVDDLLEAHVYHVNYYPLLLSGYSLALVIATNFLSQAADKGCMQHQSINS